MIPDLLISSPKLDINLLTVLCKLSYYEFNTNQSLLMKRILLASIGQSPQIITETLYYYEIICEKRIDDVHVITDIQGKDILKYRIYDKDVDIMLLDDVLNTLVIGDSMIFP